MGCGRNSGPACPCLQHPAAFVITQRPGKAEPGEILIGPDNPRLDPDAAPLQCDLRMPARRLFHADLGTKVAKVDQLRPHAPPPPEHDDIQRARVPLGLPVVDTSHPSQDHHERREDKQEDRDGTPDRGIALDPPRVAAEIRQCGKPGLTRRARPRRPRQPPGWRTLGLRSARRIGVSPLFLAGAIQRDPQAAKPARRAHKGLVCQNRRCRGAPRGQVHRLLSAGGEIVQELRIEPRHAGLPRNPRPRPDRPQRIGNRRTDAPAPAGIARDGRVDGPHVGQQGALRSLLRPRGRGCGKQHGGQQREQGVSGRHWRRSMQLPPLWVVGQDACTKAANSW